MIIIDLGDDYFLRGSRERVGSFSIVAIDWEHPNYGYFADAMLWYKSPHRINWVSIPIVEWSDNYRDLSYFLDNFPEFSKLFENDFF